MSRNVDEKTIRLKIDGKEVINSYEELSAVKKQLIKDLRGLEEGTDAYVKKSKELEQVADRLEQVRQKNNQVANAWKRMTEQFKKDLNEQLLALRENATKQGLSQDELNARKEQLELDHLREMREQRIKHGKDVSDINLQIADKELNIIKLSHERKERELKQRQQQEIIDLKKSLLKKEITQEQFHEKSEEAALRHLNQLRELRKKAGKDTLDLDNRIADKQIAIQTKSNKEVSDVIRASVEDRINSMSLFGHSVGDLREQYKMLTTSVNGTTRATKLLKLALIATGVGALLALIGSVIAATKAWYDYNKEITKTTRLTKALTDLSGDALKALRSDIQATADSFGVEFQDVLEATNALAEQMGISFGEALQEIDRGLARSTKRDEFLEQVKEYPGVFEKAGGSARDFQNILIEGERSGVFQDKLIDAIKEADIKLSEMADSTKEALSNAFGDEFARDMAMRLETGSLTTLGALKEISQQAEKTGLNVKQTAAITADVMGGPAEDAAGYAKVLETINKAYDTGRQKLNNLEQSQMTQLKANKELERAWAALFDSSDGFFQKTTASIKLFTTKAMLSAIKAVINFANGFIEAYNQFMLLRYGIQQFFLLVKTGFQLLMLPLKIFWNNLKAIGNFLVGMVTWDFKKMGAALSDGFEGYTTILKEEAKKMAKNFTDAFNETAKGKIDPIKLTLDDSEVNKKPDGKSTTAPSGPSADTELENLERTSKERLLALKRRLLNEQITQAQYDRLTQQHELANLERMRKIRKKHGLDTLDIDQEILDKQLELRQAGDEQLKELMDKADADVEKGKQDHLDKLNAEHERSLINLKNQLANGEITQAAFEAQREANELAHLENLLETQELFGMDTLDLEQQIADMRVAQAEKQREKTLEKAEQEHEQDQRELKEKWLNKQITEKEYQQQKEQMELDHLIRMRDMREQLGLDTLDVEQQIADKRLEILAETAEREKSLTQSIKELAKSKVEAFATESAAAIENAKNFKEAGKGILRSLRKQVKGFISTSITKVLGDVLAKLPFPANLIAAPLAAAGASALFERLVPSFFTGGYTGSGDIGLGRNRGGNIRGVVEDNEFVVNAQGLQRILADPYGANVMTYLEGMNRGQAPAAPQSIQVSNTLDHSPLQQIVDAVVDEMRALRSQPIEAKVSRRVGRKMVEDANEDLAHRNEARNRGGSSTNN